MVSITINRCDRLSLLLLTVCGAVCGAMGQDGCAESARAGTPVCINIYQCKPVLQLIDDAEKPLSSAMERHIKSLHCGFDGNLPKVWCEQQTATTAKSVTEDPPDVSNHVNLRMINPMSCGPAWESKIHGGNKTAIFDYPWMALLAYTTAGDRHLGFRCGGTVINERYILTAAHCVLNLRGAVVSSVRVGEHTISTERDCNIDENGEELACAEKYQDINVESIHPHPEYVIKNTANDIALVRLSRDIDFTPKNVKPICLPVGSAATPATKKVTVTGWGTTENGTQSDVLLQIQVLPVTTDECANVYRKLVKISRKQLCAGGRSGVDACTGDSGGPLQARARYHNTVKFVQYGIVSFGIQDGCGTEGVPGVYTNVVYYMDWILNTIRP